MREIKYKAWLKNKKKIVKVKAIDFIEEEIRVGGNWYSFEDVELIEYTNLKDKNGVEIFEGDIVKDDKGRIFVIEYKFGGFNIVPLMGLNDEFSWNPLGDMQTAGWLNESAEIIGNIYENKELLNE